MVDKKLRWIAPTRIVLITTVLFTVFEIIMLARVYPAAIISTLRNGLIVVLILFLIDKGTGYIVKRVNWWLVQILFLLFTIATVIFILAMAHAYAD